MSAAYYVPGTLYTVGTNPVIKLLNVRNTRTFSEFIVRGANAGPLTPGMKVRLRNYPDTAGPEVYPYGRATGQPGMVPAPSLDPFWGDRLCSPAGAISAGNLDNAMQSPYTAAATAGQCQRWMFGFSAGFIPWTVAIPAYSAGDSWNALGTRTLTTCITNDTGANVVPKIAFDSQAGLNVAITGTFEMTWNDTVLFSVTDSSIDLTSDVFTAPTLPAGVTATSIIQLKVTNVTALTGGLQFKLTL